jgi:cyclopropane fatty-acyl-phospholipid synthase-like methyltransferase
MSLRLHEISEAGHRILNPLTDAKLMLLGSVSRIGPDTRVLDLACGKGELLCRWAREYHAHGHGIDLSHVFLAAARARVGPVRRRTVVDAHRVAAHPRRRSRGGGRAGVP